MPDFRWTADEDARALDGWVRGLSCREIAATMRGRSRDAVKVRLRRLRGGVLKNRPPTPRAKRGEPPQTYRFCTTEKQEDAFEALMAKRAYEDRRFKSGRLA